MIHLEDDTIVSHDFFSYMDWGIRQAKENHDIFAVCGMISKQHKPWYKLNNNPHESFLADHFECQGGWAMTNEEADNILLMGGPFGVHGNTNYGGDDVDPEDWKKHLMITNKGSWAWPFNKYFKRDKKVILPMLSRGNNIGDERGVFNPGKQWHADHIWDDSWLGSKEIKYVIHEYKLV